MALARKDISTLWDRDMRIAIDENFKELYSEYTQAGLDAKDARNKAIQAVADALTAKEVANVTREEMLAIIREQTQNGDLAPEIAQARQGEQTLGDNLNSIKSNLAHNANKLNVQDWELNSKHRNIKGITVFTSDDGKIEEYTVAKPIFESEGVPHCIGVVPAWIGTNGFMNASQIKELEEMGWEIMSHSLEHPTASNPPLIPDMTHAQAERQIGDSITVLREMGFNVNNYVHPGGMYAKRERLLTRKYYRAARTSDIGRHDGFNSLPLESHDLKSIWLDPSSYPLSSFLTQYDKATAIQMIKDRIRSGIDRARDIGGIMIISTHFTTINDTDFQNMYRDIIRYAKQQTQVMTLNDALNEVGNIVEVGDFSKYSTDEKKGDKHFVVGANGVIDGSATVVDTDAFDPTTNYRDFPFGITYCPISTEKAVATGTPGGTAGTLINYRINNDQVGYNYQEFRPFREKHSYIRWIGTNYLFTNWVINDDSSIANEKYYLFSNGLNVFPIGTSYSLVNSSHSELNKAPMGEAGLLITHKVSPSGTWSLNYQEYRLSFRSKGQITFTRNALSDTTWSDWVPNKTVFLPSEITNNLNQGVDSYFEGISYVRLTSSNDLTNAPEQKPGLLITHKVSPTGSWSFNFQEYHLNYETGLGIYKRVATSGSAWGNWVKVSV